MKNNDFVIPTFLKKDKSSKVKAINIHNTNRIKDFMKDPEVGDCISDPDEEEIILSEDEINYIKEDEKAIKYADAIAEELKCIQTEKNKSLNEQHVSEAQLKSIERMAKALRPEEIKVILNNIPVKYIYDKIGEELDKCYKFNAAILEATDIIK